MVVGYNRTQAQNNYPFSIPEANFEGTRKNNDALFNNFNLKLEANLGKRNTLTLSTLYLGKEQGSPGGVPIPVPQFGQGFFNSLTENNRKYTDQVLTDLTWNSKLGNGDNNNARVNVDGGNDYWEGGISNPDIVLADLIKILHPELLPEHQLFYYRKLPK